MGLVLRNTETGQDEEIATEAVPNAILTGRYGAPAGTRIPVKFRDGGFGDVGIENAYEQFKRGAQFDPPEAQEERAREEKYGNRPLAAGALGGLSGLLPVIGPEILRATGAVEPGTMEGLKKYNPAAFGVGEVGLGLASIIASGGAGAGAKGAAKVAGEAGAGAAARAAAKTALSYAPPALIAKAGRGVEEVAAAMLGPAAGRSMIGKAIPKLAAGTVEGAAYGGLNDLNEDALGETDLVADHFLAGAKKGALFGLGAAGVLAGGGALLENALRPAFKEATKRFTQKNVGELLTEWKKKRIAKATFGEQVAAETDLSVKKSGSFSMYGKKWANRWEATKDYLNDVMFPRVGGAATKEEMAAAITKRRGEVLSEMQAAEKRLGATALPFEMPTKIELLTALDKRVGKYAGLPGKRGVVRALEAERNAYDELLPDGPIEFSRVMEYRRAAKPDPKDFLSTPGDLRRAKKDTYTALNDVIYHRAGQVEGRLGLEIGAFRSINNEFSLLEDINKYAQTAVRRARKNNAIPLTGHIWGGAGGATGAILGGPVGAAIGAVAGTVGRTVLRERGDMMLATAADKVTNLAKLRVIRATADKTAKRVQGAVDLAMTLAGKAVRPASVRVLSESTFDGPTFKNSKDAYAARTAEVRKLAANPAMLTERIARGAAHMNGAAPKVSARVQAAAIAQLTYLNGRIYDPPYPTGLSHLDQPDAPEWARGAFNRVYQAFDQPVSVLEEAAAGSSNLEGWAFVERFYPAMMADFKLKMATALSKLEKPPDYRLRLRLTQMGMMADPTALPAVYGAVQASYLVAGEPTGGGRPGKSVQGDVAQTSVDRVAAGR